jgi:hypothetical protein
MIGAAGMIVTFVVSSAHNVRALYAEETPACRARAGYAAVAPIAQINEPSRGGRL